MHKERHPSGCDISGWGRYPVQHAEIATPLSFSHCAELITQSTGIIPRGLGRSYGDSSLSAHVIDTRHLNYFIAFDERAGILTCAAGVSLHDILQIIIPKKWFLPVTPGTQYVTLGGAIASDVHGKNHHNSGCFGDHVIEMELLLGNGERLKITPASHSDLFNATCGGMGLTGLILSATIQLKRTASSRIIQTEIKTKNITETLIAFEENNASTYSVAWIDCLARGKQLGRSIISLGEHADDEIYNTHNKKSLSIPINMPSQLLNYYSVKTFNALYYRKSFKQTVSYEDFFYPLDKIKNWNRLYGKNGFVQYQCVLPKASGFAGLTLILEKIAQSGLGSFLAVLKMLGKQNNHLLSFPMEGYTMALDFKVQPKTFALLRELDCIVLEYGGKNYLTKDAVMLEDTFKKSYPQWEAFEFVRQKYHAAGVFSSNQSRRLGLQ